LSVSGILLAAGQSVRFGEKTKQLLDFDGYPLVRRVALVACLSSLGEVLAVTGHKASKIENALKGLGIRNKFNPFYQEGLSTSIKVGIQNLEPTAKAAIFIAVDQPFITTALINTIIAVYTKKRSNIVAPVFEGRRGSPVLFDKSLFGDLLELEKDQGGRRIIQNRIEMLETVELKSPLPLEDIDTWGEYKHLLGYTSVVTDES